MTTITATTTVVSHPSHTSHRKKHAPHRSRISIVNSILTAVSQAENETATKTFIMYTTELSWTQLRKYISYLVANEMLVCRPATQAELAESSNVKEWFSVTRKAKIFLKLYDSIHKDDLLYGLSAIREVRQGEGLRHDTKEKGGVA